MQAYNVAFVVGVQETSSTCGRPVCWLRKRFSPVHTALSWSWCSWRCIVCSVSRIPSTIVVCLLWRSCCHDLSSSCRCVRSVSSAVRRARDQAHADGYTRFPGDESRAAVGSHNVGDVLVRNHVALLFRQPTRDRRTTHSLLQVRSILKGCTTFV